MTLTDPNDQASPVEAAEEAVENLPETESSSLETAGEQTPRRILIGSQRDPGAYRPKPRHEIKPLKKPKKRREERGGGRESTPEQASASEQGLAASAVSEPTPTPTVATPQHHTSELVAQLAEALAGQPTTVAKPSVRDRLTPEMEEELRQAMGDASMDEYLDPSANVSAPQILEAGESQAGRVIAVRRDDVFVELAGHQQGVAPLKLFDVPPAVGAEVQVVVERLNPEDGLYELSLPNKAVQVDDWSDLVEGAMIEVRVTGHNTGGLECEVNHIRGFIPVSQIDLYRVEDMAQYVDQRWTCIITESNPDRRNLVLSRRAVLERERERAKEELLNSLQPGQVHEGVVRKLMDFGAFVDLGGVDGLIHVSQVAWGRVAHPSDVLKEGQQVKVRVEKVNPETGKISLAYRDLQNNPWDAAALKYPANSVAKGTVTKLMDFGAFVEVEPGIEGLIHVSELSHKRIWRPSDVVKEGQEVEVMVLSVDSEAQRMSLSMKELTAPPEPTKKESDEPGEPAVKSKNRAKPTGPLLGGLGRKTGDRFGLKW